MPSLWLIAGVVAFLLLLVAAIAFVRRLRARRSDDDSGPVSLVILRETPIELTESRVKSAYLKAFGVEPEVQCIELDEQTSSFLVCNEGMPPMAVLDSRRPYVTQEEQAAAGLGAEDPRTRDALAKHHAWVSVDAVGLDAGQQQPELLADAYVILGKLLAQFVERDSLILYAPASGRFGPVHGKTAAMLREGRVIELLGDERLNAPIRWIESTDDAINAAIKTAQMRLPELLSAYESRGDEANAAVKVAFPVAGGGNEHLWLSVRGVTDRAIRGEMLNRAADPALPAEGDPVDIDPAAVSDWMYTDENGVQQGGFVERLL
jgi:uncharacterized protein YegJ (DUF2314 family)